jgi:hypothetical protein
MAEHVFADLARAMKVPDEKRDDVVKLHMELLRQSVKDIDVSGGAKGGNA